MSAPLRAAIDEAVAADVAWSRRYATLGTAFRVLISADFVVVVPVGVWLWTTGRSTAETVLLVLLLAAGIHQPLERAYRLGFRLSWVGYAGATVGEMLRAPALHDPTEPVRTDGNDVRFDRVTFSHEPPTPTLHAVSFDAAPGRVTALVGPSGGGKSTIVRLLARFWDADQGSIRIGGVDVRDLAVDDLLSRLALVFQDPFVFRDTVADNVRLGRRDATDAEVVAACRAARIHDVITSLPHGYDTVIGADGVELSGGERQRLTIARAILRDAPIVVLDEATAMCDPDNETAIQAAISELVRGRTLIVVAHRLRTITSADHIVVVDSGTVVEHGRHDDLMRGGGVYERMWNDMLVAESVPLGSERVR